MEKRQLPPTEKIQHQMQFINSLADVHCIKRHKFFGNKYKGTSTHMNLQPYEHKLLHRKL
ncbi:hypothetical protein C0J52_19296 [Blattella germanica]|nr:hypothetical protein C0J52_19296 [Blattella germanica]